MSALPPIWAVVPLKDSTAAKQRLAGILPTQPRRALALAMAEDVLETLAAVRALAGIIVVTVDEVATQIATRHGAMVSCAAATEGHTAAVTEAARMLAAQGAAMLTLPGDVPLVTPRDIERILATHRSVPGFTIVPARDELGSNAILCSPADAVPLRFGENSFFPHLAAARARSIEPVILPLPNLGLDIDGPDDLAAFLKIPSRTRARALFEHEALAAQLSSSEAQP
jgi:2-phospho-L-lactate guanylyltransferase